MRVPTGRYTPPGNNIEHESHRKNADLLSRRLAKQPKPPPPATGGGILGIGIVEAVASSLVYAAGGGLDEFSVTYGTPWDYGVAGFMPASQFITAAGNKLNLAAGSYTVTVLLDWGWAAGVTPPPALGVGIVNAGAQTDALTGGWWDGYHAPIQMPGGSGINVLVPVTTRVTDSNGLWVQTDAAGGGPSVTGPAVSFSGAGSASLLWQIVKLG